MDSLLRLFLHPFLLVSRIQDFWPSKENGFFSRVNCTTPHRMAVTPITDSLPPAIIDPLSGRCRQFCRGCRYRHNTIHSMLYRFPHEIILEIQDILPPSSHRSLSNTSHRFRQLYGGRSLSDSDSFEFLCLLERDQSSKLVCKRCRKFHKPDQFSGEERVKPPEDRLCRGAKGLLWLCPYTAITYGDLKTRMEDGSLVHCSHESCQYSSGARWFVEDGCFGFHTCYFLTMGYGGDIPPLKEEIADILCGFDIPICPHLRTSDLTVLNSYNARMVKCQDCSTTLKLRAVPAFGLIYTYRACYVALCISRRVGTLRTPTDPRWLSQLAEDTDAASTTTEWVSSNFWLCQRESYKINALWPKRDAEDVFINVFTFCKRERKFDDLYHGNRLRKEFKKVAKFELPTKMRWKSFWVPLILPPKGKVDHYDGHFKNSLTLPAPF